MLFRIHMEYDDGSKDFIDVEGDSIEEIQNQAEREVLIQHLTTLLQISENN